MHPRRALSGAPLADNTKIVQGDCVSITVRDTGFGMSEDVQRRVFEPYFTTKQADQGTGLGLAQVYGIVTQSGGAVRIESQENVGTSVVLSLPRSHEPVMQAPATLEAVSTKNLADKTLLIVEDDDAVADVVEALPREANCKPTRAANAAAALAILSEGSRFDLISRTSSCRAR